MSSDRANLVVALFLGGIVLGVVAHVAFTPAAPASPYRSLARADEPSVAAAVVRAIASDDPKTLGRLISDKDLLSSLHQALDPIVQVDDLKFVGAVEGQRQVLSAYLARGRDTRGDKVIRGFVLHVEGDGVIGVN